MKTRIVHVILVLILVVGFLPIFVKYYFGYLTHRLRQQHKYWD